MKQVKDQQQGLRSGAVDVIKKLQANSFTAYLAGGAVRDILLGRDPVDYDIATDAIPDQVLSLFSKSQLVGKSFGVVRVLEGENWYEIASFRSDSTYSDGRHPDSISYADARTDALRRDFTVNAVFYDPVANKFHDYTGGIPDAEEGILRCVGNASDRFKEDHLRLLRAVRFAYSHDLRINKETDASIRDHADMVSRISPERIRQELTRILTEASLPGAALIYLQDTGLLERILPEISALCGVTQPPDYHPEGDVFDHTVNMLNSMTAPSALLAFSILLHDTGKPGTRTIEDERIRFKGHAGNGADIATEILTRLRFSNSDRDQIVHCVRNHSRLADASKMRESKLRRLLAEPTFPIELELHRIDRLCASGDMSNYEFLVNALDRYSKETPLPPALLTGKDLIEKGVEPGPLLGEMLDEAYEFQLENQEMTKSDLLREVGQE